ncbi:unnamed protein product [Linum tenue]|uniref:S-protein homolog n=1 Tax=Linum tenue TaxID=586396 RepID=A0AAV0ICJ9_9ROSI|nr:unnamed protein product [Linum tenue]
MVIHKKLQFAAVLLATVVAALATNQPDNLPNELTVHVISNLRDKILIVHCQSESFDLGARVLEIGRGFSWGFRRKFNTHFRCDLAVEDKRLTVDAFVNGGTYRKYIYVRDSGVYGEDLIAVWRQI